MSDEKQTNPIDNLEDIRDIAAALRELAIDHQLQMTGSMYIADEMARIIELATSLLDGAKANPEIKRTGFWLKLCAPLPEVDEKDLKDRVWAISIDELEGNK